MKLTRHEVLARLKAAVLVLGVVTVIIGPLSYAISPRVQDLVFALGAGLALGVGIALRAGGRGGAMLGIGVGFVAGLAAAILTGNTTGRGISILVPPVVGLCIGFMEGFEPPRHRTYRQMVVSAVIIGGVIGLGMSLALSWPGLLAGVITGLLVGMVSGMRANSPARRGVRFHRPPPLMLVLASLSIVLVTALAWRELSWKALPSVLIFVLLVPALCFLLGLSMARWLRPRLTIYGELSGYLRVMWVPMGGFALGYLALIVVFAGFYGALHRCSPHAFIAGERTSVLDWWFYSLFTATGQEYSGISPASGWARLLVSLETILCLGWIVVVFAAVMAYLQPRLERLTAQKDADGVK